MKYGIYFAYWAREWDVPFLPYVERVAKLGFDVLEISCAALPQMSDRHLRALRNAAEDHGIGLTAGYGPSAEQNLASDDPGVVSNAIAFYSDVLAKLEVLGIGVLGGGIYSYWPVDYSKPIDKRGDWERSVGNVKRVAGIAADHGVDYCLEVLNRFEGYLLNTSAEAVQFVSEVDEPNVKVMLDTFHMNIEEDDFAEAIQIAGSRLGHFHVGENNRKLPTTGPLPWSRIGQALRSIGYEGHVVMEPFVMAGGRVGDDVRVWRQIVPDVDEASLDRAAAASLVDLRQAFGD